LSRSVRAVSRRRRFCSISARVRRRGVADARVGDDLGCRLLEDFLELLLAGLEPEQFLPPVDVLSEFLRVEFVGHPEELEQAGVLLLFWLLVRDV
jgi:hypothetical protein